MKNRFFRLLFLLLAGAPILLGSCNRFEEGSMSLHSVKKRLSRTWVLEQYLRDGVDETESWNSLYPGYKIEYRLNFTYEVFLENDSTYSFGVYNLQDWARKIERQPNNSPGSYIVHDIVKLSKKELWTRYNENEEFHFVAEE